MVNMHLQVNAAQSLYQVLTRAADALSSLIVCCVDIFKKMMI